MRYWKNQPQSQRGKSFLSIYGGVSHCEARPTVFEGTVFYEAWAQLEQSEEKGVVGNKFYKRMTSIKM